MVPPASRETWSFRSTGMLDPRSESSDGFCERIEEALRVAPSGAGCVRWVLETGPRARAVISADSEELARWLDDVLIPTYPSGRWSATHPVHHPEVLPWIGVAHPTAIGPFPSVQDGRAPWIEPVLASALSIPKGGALAFELHPLGPPELGRSASWAGSLVHQPPGFRAATPPTPVRSNDDRLEERRVASRWSVVVRLREPLEGVDRRGGPHRLGHLVETASRREGGSGVRFRLARNWWSRTAPGLLLSSAEVAMLFPGPRGRFLPLHEDRPIGSVPLVVGAGPGGRVTRVWMDPEQGRHLVILGETGMGKSTLLLRLASQASRGAGIILFDPIGDTAHRFLGALPAVARSRTLWVSPRESPVSINALASASPGPAAQGAKSERTLDDLLNALRRVRENRFGAAPFWGPRIEETVRKALAAASALPHGTLVDAERLLSSPGRMSHGIPPEARPEVLALRQQVMERPEEVDGARRLLGEIANHATLRSMLCDPEARSTVGQWTEPGRITVVSGDAREVGETGARYLLSILLALVWTELMARRPGSKTIIILDEAQWYAHETVAEILRLGRRENVHLWMATQALASLPDAVSEAARTNAADFVLFRGSPDEAREFHRWLPNVSEESLLALASGQALVLVGKGEDVQWTSVPRNSRPLAIEEALQTARDNSRPFWPTSAVGEPAEPPAAAPATDVGTLSPAVRWILLLLWAGLLEANPAPELVVPLVPFRAAFDPEGSSLRTVGGLLARTGALSETGEGRRGRFWRVQREAFGAGFSRGIDPSELTRATDAWRGFQAQSGRSE